MASNKQLLKKISEEFAKGNFSFSESYLAEDIKWNILGEETIVGKEQVLELSKMAQLQSFPLIKIKNIICEGDYVVIESTGEAKTIKASRTTKYIATFIGLTMKSFRK